MHYCKYLILIICCFPAALFAQSSANIETDITGLWKGTLYNDTTKQFYRYEIAISEEKGKLTGYSHTWFILDDKQYYGVKKVKIKKVDDKIIIEDNGLIANNYPEAPAKGVRQLNVLELNTSDSIMTLIGPFTTNRTKEYSSLTGTINLQRKNDYWQSALVPHLEELGLANDLSFVKDDIVLKRNNDAMKATEIAIVKPKDRAVTGPSKAIANNKPIQPISTTENNSAITKNETVKNNSPVQKNNAKEKTDIAKVEKVNIPVKKAPALRSDKTKVPVVAEPKPSIAATQNPVIKEKTITEKEKTVDSSTTTIAKPVVVAPPIALVKTDPPALDVEIRKTLLQQTVFFRSDSLQLSLYDNGEVDGDTVSVLMNGNVIMPRVGLSTNAVRKTIFIDPNEDSVQLIMYAENLGSIPPNTGLLVVKDGKSIYEIRFSGDLQKNAAIIFRRKKE